MSITFCFVLEGVGPLREPRGPPQGPMGGTTGESILAEGITRRGKEEII